MRAKENRQQILKLITRDVPKDFLQQVIEELPSAYGRAYSSVKALTPALEPVEVRRLLPQERHYVQNAAFRKAATSVGLPSMVKATSPRGEHYPIVAAGEVLIGRIGVAFASRLPRLAKHRRLLACLNSRFEPMNGDLFDPPALAAHEGMGAIVVTINPPPSAASQELPLGLFMGVPFTNFKGWHYYAPFEEVIAAYHEEVVQEQPDLAWATLKKRLEG